jgi:hypothetical protein
MSDADAQEAVMRDLRDQLAGQEALLRHATKSVSAAADGLRNLVGADAALDELDADPTNLGDALTRLDFAVVAVGASMLRTSKALEEIHVQAQEVLDQRRKIADLGLELAENVMRLSSDEAKGEVWVHRVLLGAAVASLTTALLGQPELALFLALLVLVLHAAGGIYINKQRVNDRGKALAKLNEVKAARATQETGK